MNVSNISTYSDILCNLSVVTYHQSLPSPLSEQRRYYGARRLCGCVCVRGAATVALVSAAKVMRCTQCSLVIVIIIFSITIIIIIIIIK